MLEGKKKEILFIQWQKFSNTFVCSNLESKTVSSKMNDLGKEISKENDESDI